ncbi:MULTISPECIES: TetR/AcrR family transcriptional regulator [Streptomyces]|uniref:TetR/AcrR family transcriptional regulator n=1 Tax=Streptomyces TaxID=1883 RepID=UPI00163CCA5F|nr:MULTISPECIES: TetR/AcrR family transcriptional regulator [Streptomyces]MBC2877562.1 TetR/AcrR family transcriptional regulator [Streptomyces sp. TYQ1024]UBI36200.1 TetR/AcrR family transcriptional regulator [Streptomyces mobaraensis]UKW28793.1 TetR/AcrR family transcriptional regulator [Streptomyces sp. TYQ1024]
MTAKSKDSRPGGRSARIRSAVHQAVVDLVGEIGADKVTVPAVARRAGVHPSSVYRRWGTTSALLADVADSRQEEEAPELLGDLRQDLERAAVWTLADLSRPGGVAFFRAEVAPDVDERRAGLRACLERVSARFGAPLEAAAGRGETPPSLERVLDRVVAPLYFRVVFSVPGTDERYARDLVAELCAGHPAGTSG